MSTQPVLSSDAVLLLYEDHHGWLQAWLRKKLSSAADAADIAHDTFVRVLASRGKPAPAEPRALLTTIAKGLLIDQWRRREIEKAYLDALASLPEAVAPSPESQLLVIELLLRVDRMLDGLAPKARTAFLLAQVDGLPYAEIARRLEVSVRSVERYIAQALFQCHLLLEEE